MSILWNGDWGTRFPTDSAIVKYCKNLDETTAQITSEDLEKAFGLEPHIARLFAMLVARNARFNHAYENTENHENYMKIIGKSQKIHIRKYTEHRKKYENI